MNRALPLALALAATALLAGCPSSTRETCLLPSIKCGDRCVDGGSDPSNCGACGHACATGTTCCNGSCTDPGGNDPANCGACGHACPEHGVCTAGACSCPGALPTQCGTSPGACVDLTLDPQHCGSCGQACQGAGVAAADATCTSSACVCAGTAAATDCGGNPRCVSLLQDGRNCGSCGHACTNRATCAAGACTCGAAAYPDNCGTLVDPVCVSTSTDPLNCGACGHGCAATTPSCQGGLCCAAGQSNCSGHCVDTKANRSSCGACGHACAPGQDCSNGVCVCGGTTALACGTSCCAGSACCSGGTACQTAHSNGLGGTFRDCTAAPYSATNPWTQAAATAAAESWAAGTSWQGLCDGSCVGRQTSNSCAVWCYGLSSYAGKVTVSTATNSCVAVCNNFYGNVAVAPWQ